MPYRKFIAESSDPAPTHKRIDFDGLMFFRTFFPAGSWQVYQYHAPVRYCDAPSCHIQTLGVVSEKHGAWPDHGPGWLSRRDEMLITPGTYTRVARTDAERWCCLGMIGGGPAEGVDTVFIRDGGSIELPAGSSIFPVLGRVSVGSLQSNHGARIKCSSGPAVASAIGDVLAFVW